jgi:hypothetical protein
MGLVEAIVDYLVATFWQLSPLFTIAGAVTVGVKIANAAISFIKGQAPRNK